MERICYLYFEKPGFKRGEKKTEDILEKVDLKDVCLKDF